MQKMSSPAFKTFVGSRMVHKKEDRNVTHTVHLSEASDNFFLSTASWPELPKSQNAHKHNHNNQKTSNATTKKITCDIHSTCKQSCTSVKSPNEFSENGMAEEEQITKIGASLVPAYSEENYSQSNNSKKDQTFPLSRNSNQNCAVGSESNDFPNSASLDGRRRNQAKKKSLLKEEKKRMREAEILRKRVEPKGQGVKVISHKLLEMVLKSNKDSISVNTQQTCNIAGLNFPTLEEATKKTKNKTIKERSSCSPENNENCASENIVANTVISKKSKHKKPMEIDIHNLIKDSSRKSSDKGYRSTKGQSHSKAKQNVPDIGNQLDSSNPERKRGKKRERPKKKRFTLLKTAILEARAIRKHLQELEQQSKNDADLPEVNCCISELNEPVKVGIQHTKALPSEQYEHKEEALKCKTIEKENLNKKVSVADDAKIEVGLLQDMSVSRLPLSEHSKDCASNFQHSKSLNINLLSKAASKSGEGNKPLLTEKVQLPAQKFVQHSRKFRDYCDHILTEDLNNAVKSLIENIVKFQDRLYQRDPIKAFARRRYVVGFREVKKYLQLKRLKLLIIAPDLEVAKTKGGTDDAVAELKDMANLQSLPYVFALNRRTLGHITFKKVGVSCIGVVNYEGAENTFATIIEAMSIARKEYNKLVNDTSVIPEKEEPEETKDKVEISAYIAASLLAKLREKSAEDEAHNRDKSSPFLAAIDRVIKSEDCIDCQK